MWSSWANLMYEILAFDDYSGWDTAGPMVPFPTKDEAVAYATKWLSRCPWQVWQKETLDIVAESDMKAPSPEELACTPRAGQY
jgi:hypothetical protein